MPPVVIWSRLLPVILPRMPASLRASSICCPAARVRRLAGFAVAVAAAPLGLRVRIHAPSKITANFLELIEGHRRLDDLSAERTVSSSGPRARRELEVAPDRRRPFGHELGPRSKADGDSHPTASSVSSSRPYSVNFVASPDVRALESGGAREPWADLLADVGEGLPDLGVVLALLDDRVDDGCLDRAPISASSSDPLRRSEFCENEGAASATRKTGPGARTVRNREVADHCRSCWGMLGARASDRAERTSSRRRQREP